MGYDSRFRQLRAHPGTCIPLDTFHPELRVKNSVRPQVLLTKTLGPGHKNKTSNLANVPNGFIDTAIKTINTAKKSKAGPQEKHSREDG